ncbi:MAG: cadherin-like domain-containing protein [Methylovulum sp.]|nr:cadherin-like domain-containing protein [Methylovulum sp.]
MTTQNGTIITDLGSSDYGYAVTILPDGKILAAGTSYISFAMARYTTNGALDPTFSDDGILTKDFSGANGRSYNFNLTGEGKVLASYYNNFGVPGTFTLARYHPDSSLDESFGIQGILNIDFGSDNAGKNFTLLADGKMLVVGQTNSTTNADFVLTRYTMTGDLDASFGNGGKVNTDFGSGDFANGVAVQPDGKILMTGKSYFKGLADFSVARFNPDGSLDTTFDHDGKLNTDFGGNDGGYGVAVQADGKIVVAGNTLVNAQRDFAVARYNSDGSLDKTFSGDGKLTTDFGGLDEYSKSLAIQPDGKLVVIGYTNAGGTIDFVLARYNPDGSLDSKFNGLDNQPPELTGTLATLVNGKANAFYTLQVSDLLQGFSDPDDGDILSITGLTANHGSLSDNLDGTWSFTPQTDYKGLVDLNYTVTDGKNGTAASQHFSLQANTTTAAGVSFNHLNGATNEMGGKADFLVMLTAAPTSRVTLTFQSSNDHEGQVFTDKLIFTGQNWNIPQTLTVQGMADYLNDGDASYNINTQITTNAPAYSAVDVAKIVLININDPNDVPIVDWNGTNQIDRKTGSNSADALYGQGGADVLKGGRGDDHLYGQGGSDTLLGELGDDTLYGDYGNDTLAGGEGNDTLYGEQDNDYMEGGTGDDSLFGTGGGLDTMSGGAGNDTYYLDFDGLKDIVSDNGLAADIDTIIMPFQLTRYTLPAGIEKGIIAAGQQNSSLTGNASNNGLTGNAGRNTLDGAVGRDSLFGGNGNDVLIGGTGNDTLNGGAGRDIFKFNATLTANTDRIIDFAVTDDTIQLDHAIFTQLTTAGTLNASLFVQGATAMDLDDHIIYNPATGMVMYDSDGAGTEASVQIALLAVNLPLTHTNFEVV